MRAPDPVLTSHLFAPLNGELIALLRGLSPDEWSAPTVAGSWTVKDVAAHLLDTALRRLSIHRDGHVPPSTGSRNISELVNGLNAEGVAFARRHSPRVLTDLLEVAGDQQAEFFATLDPFGEAKWSVSWAGESVSQNWLDVARELTERWHHQQQIRDATHRPPLYELYLGPVIATFVRALPVTYRDVAASAGTAIVFRSTEDWSLVREEEEWRLYSGIAPSPAATVTMPADTAWRLFTKGLTREEARSRTSVEGDAHLGEALFGTISIIG